MNNDKNNNSTSTTFFRRLLYFGIGAAALAAVTTAFLRHLREKYRPPQLTPLDLSNTQLASLLRQLNVSDNVVRVIEDDKYTGRDFFGTRSFINDAFDGDTCATYKIKKPHLATLEQVRAEIMNCREHKHLFASQEQEEQKQEPVAAAAAAAPVAAAPLTATARSASSSMVAAASSSLNTTATTTRSNLLMLAEQVTSTVFNFHVLSTNEMILELRKKLAQRYHDKFSNLVAGGVGVLGQDGNKQQSTHVQVNFFVNLRLRRDVNRHHHHVDQQHNSNNNNVPALVSSNDPGEAVTSTQSLPQRVAESRQRGIVVAELVGEAGAGKSALARHLCATQPFEHALIVFVPLRDLLSSTDDDSNNSCKMSTLTSVSHLLELCTAGDILGAKVRERIVSDRIPILWILDGYDEIVPATTAAADCALAEFLRQFADPRTRQRNLEDGEREELVRPCDFVVVTSRERGSGGGGGGPCNFDAGRCDQWKLQRWTESEVATFCHNWFSSPAFQQTLSQSEREEAARDVIETSRAPEFEFFAGLPLIITQLCTLRSSSSSSSSEEQDRRFTRMLSPSVLFEELTALSWRRNEHRIDSFLSKVAQKPHLVGNAMLQISCLDAAARHSFLQLVGTEIQQSKSNSNSDSNNRAAKIAMKHDNSIKSNEVACLVFEGSKPIPLWAELFRECGLLQFDEHHHHHHHHQQQQHHDKAQQQKQQEHQPPHRARPPHRSWIEFLCARWISCNADHKIVAASASSSSGDKDSSSSASSNGNNTLVPLLTALPFSDNFATVWVLLADLVRRHNIATSSTIVAGRAAPAAAAEADNNSDKKKRHYLTQTEFVSGACDKFCRSIVQYMAPFTESKAISAPPKNDDDEEEEEDGNRCLVSVEFIDDPERDDKYAAAVLLQVQLRVIATIGADTMLTALESAAAKYHLIRNSTANTTTTTTRSSSRACEEFWRNRLDFFLFHLQRLAEFAPREGTLSVLEWIEQQERHKGALTITNLYNPRPVLSVALLRALDHHERPAVSRCVHRLLTPPYSVNVDLKTAVAVESVVGVTRAVQSASSSAFAFRALEMEQLLAVALCKGNFDIAAALLSCCRSNAWTNALEVDLIKFLVREVLPAEISVWDEEAGCFLTGVNTAEFVSKSLQLQNTTSSGDAEQQQLCSRFLRYCNRLPLLLTACILSGKIRTVIQQHHADGTDNSRDVLLTPHANSSASSSSSFGPEIIRLTRAELSDRVCDELLPLFQSSTLSQNLRAFTAPLYLPATPALAAIARNCPRLERLECSFKLADPVEEERMYNISTQAQLPRKSNEQQQQDQEEDQVPLFALPRELADFAQVTRRCRALRHLRILFVQTGINARPLLARELAAILEPTESRLVSLATHHLSNEGAAVVARCCPLLTQLNVQMSFRLTSAGLRCLAEHCTRLEIMDASRVALGADISDGVTAFATFFSQKRNQQAATTAATQRRCLKVFELRHNTFSDEALSAIAEHLSGALERLDLGRGGFTESGVLALAQEQWKIVGGKSSNTKLKMLNLGGVSFVPAAAIEELCESISDTVQHLDISGCHEVTVRDSAHKFSKLRVLIADGASLTDRVVCEIARAAAKNLQHLDVWGFGAHTNVLEKCNPITDASLFELSEHCPNLAQLLVGNAPSVTDAGVIAVIEKCPIQQLNVVFCDIGDDTLRAMAKGTAKANASLRSMDVRTRAAAVNDKKNEQQQKRRAEELGAALVAVMKECKKVQAIACDSAVGELPEVERTRALLGVRIKLFS